MGDKDQKEDEADGRKSGGDPLRNFQKSHLEKLMANPDKPVHIPERPEGWKPKDAPEFVRFYMGSSAGAGSEVFHVYRHLRRRENIRQQYIEENAEKDDLEMEFQIKLAQNQMEAEQRTSKKRAKRLKKKQSKLAKKAAGKEKEEEEKEEEETPQGQDGRTNFQETNSDGEGEEPHFVIGGR